jgi:hypothetical protein
VIDARLSEAVLTYVWGTGDRSWPSRDPEAVQRRFGEETSDFLPRVLAVFALVDATPPLWQTEDLMTATNRMEALVREQHPELSDDAVRAIGNEYHFAWK